MKGYEYTSPFMKKIFEDIKLKRDEGLKIGRDEGIKLGHDEGLKLGRDEGTARSVLTVLRARKIDVPEATRQRILEERDSTRLERWLERAATARSLDEVLVEPS